MNITVSVNIDKIEIEEFEKTERRIHEAVMEAGRQVLRELLEKKDEELKESRETARYRSKGLRKTCVRTMMGDVEYSRHVYQDQESLDEDGKKRSVYLLDEELGIEKIGHITANACKQIVKAVSEGSYRSAARAVSEQTGLRISAQGVWNVAQGVGEKLIRQGERNAELAETGAGTGEVVTKILYEENDGIHLHLQGESRKRYGRNREMKVGIGYDGARWILGKGGKKRRVLDNKVAIAGFLPVEEYRKRKEGVIASVFSRDEIELRVVNGDGATWMKQKQSDARICVLDKFHRNKALTESVHDPEFAQNLRTLLYANEVEKVLDCLEGQINSVMDAEEKESLQDLYDYYNGNRDILTGYYDRGIKIPETREPGVIHHARLGSMESNVFTLIGNRMKGRRFCWSIDGANHLAAILCAYHTTGLEHIFDPLPEMPAVTQEPEWVDDGAPVSAAKMPETSGFGYEPEHHVSTTNGHPFLRRISSFAPLSALSL